MPYAGSSVITAWPKLSSLGPPAGCGYRGIRRQLSYRHAEYLGQYTAMNLGAFAIIQRTGHTLEACKGMGRTQPMRGVAMTIFLISLVGIPPLAGFAGKFLLLGAALDAHFTWLALLAVLNTVLSLAVYLRIIVPMYRPCETAHQSTQQNAPGLLITTVWWIALIVTIGLGLMAQLILGVIH